MAISNPGGNLNSVPAPQKQTLDSNYIDFTASGNGWAQQYLPDLMESEAEVLVIEQYQVFYHKLEQKNL